MSSVPGHAHSLPPLIAVGRMAVGLTLLVTGTSWPV
jgi:hypothetical protein